MKLLLAMLLTFAVVGSVQGADAAEPAAIMERLGAGGDRAAMRAAMMDLLEASERVAPEAMFEPIFDWAAPRGPAGIAGPMLASRVGLAPDVVLKGLARRLGGDDPQARRFAEAWLSILSERLLDHQRMEWIKLMLPDEGEPPPAVAVAAFDASPLDAFELFTRRYGGDAAALRSVRLEVHEAVYLARLAFAHGDLVSPTQLERANALLDKLAADERWWVRGVAYALVKGQTRIKVPDLRQRKKADTFFAAP